MGTHKVSDMDDGYWASVEQDAPEETDDETSLHFPDDDASKVIEIPTDYNAVRSQIAAQHAEAQSVDVFEDFRVVPIDPDEPPPPAPTVMAIHDKHYDPKGFIFSEGTRYILTGPQASGKSWLTLALASEFIHEGKKVMWFDPDGMNKGRVVDRLRGQLKARDSDMREHFLYARARLSLTRDMQEYAQFMQEQAEAIQPALVIWDSWGPALSALGLDGNSADDVNAWWGAFVEPVSKAAPDCIQIMLDHVPKNDSDNQIRGIYGSQRKLSAPDAALTMKASTSHLGHFFINVAKDRDGVWAEWESDGLTLEIEDGGVWYITTNATPQEQKAQRDSAVAGMLMAVLKASPTPLSFKKWKDAFRSAGYTARNEVLTVAMTDLTVGGYAIPVDNIRGHAQYEWFKPYDEGKPEARSESVGLTSEPVDNSPEEEQFPF